MIGAPLLPFPAARGVNAPQHPLSSPAAGAGGFAGAMDHALGAPSTARRADDVRSASTPRTRRPETAKSPAAAREAAPPDRREKPGKRPAATPADRSGDSAADEPKAARSSGEQDATVPVAEASSPASEDRRASEAAGDSVTGDTSEETAAETLAGDAVAVAADALAYGAVGEDGVDAAPAAGTNPAGSVASGAAAGVEAETASDTPRGASRTTPGIPAHAQTGGTARARAEVVAAPGDQQSELAAGAVHGIDDTASPVADVSVVTDAVEHAGPPSAQAGGANAEAEVVEAASAVETVAGIEPGGGTDVADSGAHEQPQPREASPAPGTHAANTVAAATGASDGVRFTVNVAAGSAAYASAAPRPEDGVLPQIVQSIRLHAGQGSSEARVQLKPEHLGALNITLKVEHGNVTATIQADLAAVRQWIESHEASLRQALSEQGLQLTRLIVHPDGEQANQEGRENGEPRRQPRRRSWRDEETTFEVLV